jgi:hypothetical protein
VSSPLSQELAVFAKRRRAPSFASTLAAGVNSAALQADAAEDHTPHCGWFDSSHDLHTGLLVQEHASADAVLALLPLDDWLALQLANCCPLAAPCRH